MFHLLEGARDEFFFSMAIQTSNSLDLFADISSRLATMMSSLRLWMMYCTYSTWSTSNANPCHPPCYPSNTRLAHAHREQTQLPYCLASCWICSGSLDCSILPPNATLDVTCFGPLAHAYRTALQDFIYEHPGQSFGKQEFWECLCIALEQKLIFAVTLRLQGCGRFVHSIATKIVPLLRKPSLYPTQDRRHSNNSH